VSRGKAMLNSLDSTAVRMLLALVVALLQGGATAACACAVDASPCACASSRGVCGVRDPVPAPAADPASDHECCNPTGTAVEQSGPAPASGARPCDGGAESCPCAVYRPLEPAGQTQGAVGPAVRTATVPADLDGVPGLPAPTAPARQMRLSSGALSPPSTYLTICTLLL